MPSGEQSELKYWVYFVITVEGITRKVWAFVCPTQRRRISFLLGIPYLESMDAEIRIRDSQTDIGDSSRGEKVKTIEAPFRISEPPMVQPMDEVSSEDIGTSTSDDVDDEDSSSEDIAEEEVSDEDF